MNYLSAAYNQALLADVPTIVLFNRAAYHLTDDESTFYDQLLAAGIFQADPGKAAELVELIIHDPMSWWRSEPVHRARAEYLHRNFGPPEALGRYVVELSRQRSAA